MATTTRHVGVTSEHDPIPLLVLGTSLSAFFVISYLICILGYLLFPGLPIPHSTLNLLLPGFELLTWWSFFIGLVESFVIGWYIALLFGWLYNFFVVNWPR